MKHSETDFVCPSCGGPTRRQQVYVTMWLGGELNLIEDVPAYVCQPCSEQYYDSDVEGKIRALVAEGFPAYKAQHHVSVPVFSLDPEKPAADPVAVAKQLQRAKEVPQS